MLAVVHALPSVAQAAGFWNLGRGVSTFGRGGANFIQPRDPIAVYTNPAALAGQRGLQLMVDGNIVFDNRAFERAPSDLDADGELTEYARVQNSWAPIPPSPGGFAAYNFGSLGLPELSVGAGVWGPPRSDTEFPEAGPQRYSAISVNNLQIHYGLAAAYELPWLGLRVGATAQLIDQLVVQSLRLNVGELLFAEPEDPQYDVQAALEAQDRAIPGGTLAVSAQPWEFLGFGVSLQLPWNVDARGTADIELGEGIRDLAEVQGDAVSVQVQMPMVVRAAVGYLDPTDRFDAELAFVWEGWSRNETTRISSDDIVFINALAPDEPIPLEDIELENNWRNAFSVRMGGSYQVVAQWLRVRAGGYYERGAVPDAYLAPASFDLDKLGATAGARIDFPYGLWLDVAAGYEHWLRQDIDNTEVRFTQPVDTGDDADASTWPIANGTYQNQQFIVMAAIGMALGL